MTNKFRRMSPIQVPEDLNVKPPIVDLTQGINLSVPPRKLPLGASPNLDHVRFEAGALRKDFGSTAIGAAAPNKILAIGDYKYILGDSSFHRLIRLYLEAGFLVVDIWDGTSWVRVDISDRDVQDVYLDVASTQNRFLIADGTQILTWYEAALSETVHEDFPAGNSETAPGGSVGLFLTADANDNWYYVRHSVSLSITNGADYEVVVSIYFIDNGVRQKKRQHTYTLSAGSKTWLDELSKIASDVGGSSVQVELKIDSVTAGTGVKRWSTLGLGGVNDPYELYGTKTGIEDAVDDKYHFVFNLTGAPATVSAYLDRGDGAGFVFVGSKDFASDNAYADMFVEVDNVPDGSVFALESSPGSLSQSDFGAGDQESLVWYTVIAGTDYTLNVHGYNKEIDLDPYAGVTYTKDNPPESKLELLSPDAPGARYILPFGDRLLAYRNVADVQEAAWSADGQIDDWATGDSGSAILVDTRSDGLDDIMGAAVLTASTVAVFRKRSIMRAQETGQVALAMAHYHWIENLGTESPFSVQSTPHGVLFLGHNLQVYLLTPEGPRSVGNPIHAQLVRDLTSNLDLVDSAYDSVFGEYYLGVPEGNASNITGVWILEFDRFVETQELVWRYRSMAVQRFATVSEVE